jgi:hypothetical protein
MIIFGFVTTAYTGDIHYDTMADEGNLSVFKYSGRNSLNRTSFSDINLPESWEFWFYVNIFTHIIAHFWIRRKHADILDGTLWKIQ